MKNRTAEDIQDDISRHIEECRLLLASLQQHPNHHQKNSRRCQRISQSAAKLAALYQQKAVLAVPTKPAKQAWEGDFKPPQKSSQAFT